MARVRANDILASLNGWLVAKDAPKETVDFTQKILKLGDPNPFVT